MTACLLNGIELSIELLLRSSQKSKFVALKTDYLHRPIRPLTTTRTSIPSFNQHYFVRLSHRQFFELEILRPLQILIFLRAGPVIQVYTRHESLFDPHELRWTGCINFKVQHRVVVPDFLPKVSLSRKSAEWAHQHKNKCRSHFKTST